jgi:hypothetical protein
MNKSQRIQLNSNAINSDKYVIVKLDQDVDTLEFLSMNLSTKDVYQNFNADYGILVGRVTANGGIGVPNAKISIFIPLDSTDANDSEISSIYPYTTPRDKNSDGKRYNLLPRVAVIDPNTGISSPKQPFGSFPIKPELVTNQTFLNVYKKYYKYTALTNSSGDYMIFGVPIGTQTIHLSVDITDIGKFSMTPASMVTNLGYSANFFIDNNSKIKPNTDLGDLPNIETQEITVEIMPFWGDTTNFTIGITRQDFRIRATLLNTFIIFGSAFTDGDNSMWGANLDPNEKNVRELYYINGATDDEKEFFTGIQSKRIGNITESIYYYPNNITDAQIDSGNVKNDGSDMVLLDPSEYSVYKRDGDFAFIINCNRNKVITDENGNEISIDETSPNGIFSKFRGFITLEITSTDIPMNFSGSIGTEGGGTKVIPYRFKLKIPQFAGNAQSFTQPVLNQDVLATQNWRKQHATFSGGTLYTISNFYGTVLNTIEINNLQVLNPNTNYLILDELNAPYNFSPSTPNRDFHFQTGIIQTNDGTFEDVNVSGNAQYEMPHNSFDHNNRQFFAGNWLNFTTYLPQLGNLTLGYSSTKYVRTADKFTKQVPFDSDNHNNNYFLSDNTQPIAANQYNTKWFARSDLHWTDFVAVPKTDILTLAAIQLKGFATGITSTFKGKYRNGIYTPPNWFAPCPLNGGKLNGDPLQTPDPNTYFYKGFGSADCIDFIISLGLV